MSPWEEIPLSDYENHMRHESVRQLQALNEITRDQMSAFPVRTAMILGVAGGNGLEHADPEKYRRVWAVDVNKDYLRAVEERFGELSGILECVRTDLRRDTARLPQAELVVANLILEYIGCEALRNVVLRTEPTYLSCVIQKNGEDSWVSDSPWARSFDALGDAREEADEERLISSLGEIGFVLRARDDRPLPGKKRLTRLDFARDTTPDGLSRE